VRYYRIEIDNDDGSPFAVYTSFVNGATDPGALHVEIDITTATYATPVGASFVRVWGVPITVISQSADLNGKRIKVFAGMQRGLPLANPAQAGLLTAGRIIQAFGNWVGVNMTLDLILTPDTGSTANQKNIVLNWAAGTPLNEALRSTLATAFPDRTIDVQVSSGIVQPRQETGFWSSLDQFALWLKAKTIGATGLDYPGVDIMVTENAVRAYDATSPTVTRDIDFLDLIGQPTWIDFATVQLIVVMRADVSVGEYVRLPRAAVITTPQSQSQYRNSAVFQGAFQVRQVRHVGAYRTPDAAAWVTIIDAAALEAV
jgi:hypothetical protein